MPKFAYRPPVGDAASTEMHGLTFDANVPVEVTDKHFVEIDHPEKFEMEDGSIRSRTVRRRIPAAELLRHNPHFVEIVEDGGQSLPQSNSEAMHNGGFELKSRKAK